MASSPSFTAQPHVSREIKGGGGGQARKPEQDFLIQVIVVAFAGRCGTDSDPSPKLIKQDYLPMCKRKTSKDH